MLSYTILRFFCILLNGYWKVSVLHELNEKNDNIDFSFQLNKGSNAKQNTIMSFYDILYVASIFHALSHIDFIVHFQQMLSLT